MWRRGSTWTPLIAKTLVLVVLSRSLFKELVAGCAR
jgi:hypothetical protein